VEERVSVDEFSGAGNRADAARPADPVQLAPVAGGIATWWFALDAPPEDIDHLAASLSAAEQARAARFGTPQLRQRYLVGRGMLRRLLGEVLGIAPAAVPIRRGPRGRPEIDGMRPVDFNVSHTQGHALVGIAHDVPPSTRIGVDIERADRDVGADRLATKFLTAREGAALAPFPPDARRQRFLRHWTCKEAMSKATGDGLAAPFRHLDVELEPTPRLVAGPAPYLPGAWALHALPVPGEFLATLAVWTGAG
jgi:4'-phosphopantetheinyl transferase